MTTSSHRATATSARRFVGFFGPYRRTVAATAVGLLIGSALGVAYPLIIRAIVDKALFCGTGCPNTHRLYGLSALLVVVVIGEAGLGFATTVLATRVGERVMADLRQKLYERVKQMPLAFFTRTRAGEIQSRLLNDVRSVGQLITTGVHGVIVNIVMVISAVVAMFVMSWQLALVSVYLVPMFAWMTHRTGLAGQRKWAAVNRGYEQITTAAVETLSVAGVLAGKLFGRDRAEIERFRDLNDEQAKRLTVAETNDQVLRSALAAYLGLAPALVFLVVAIGLGPAATGATAGTIVAFAALQGRIFGPIAQLFTSAIDFRSSQDGLDRIHRYLELRPDLSPPSSVRPVLTDPNAGTVRLVSVGFSYPATTEPVLSDIDLEVRPGQFAAIVGPTGAGKTTITYLIARLYHVDRGAVLIDGYDVRKIDQEVLSRAIGLVTQETFLFHASIRDNLLYAKPDATQAEIEDAARAAYIHEQIMQFPEGYDTVVGNCGYRLSGGEKQRVSIARTVLKDPRILLLDEATSSLDNFSERVVQRALRVLMQGRTTIAIAHRLSTIQNADVIHVLDRGRIVETGSHTELLAAGALYTRLYNEQFAPERSGHLSPAVGDDARRAHAQS